MYTVEHKKHREMFFQLYNDLLEEFVAQRNLDDSKQFDNFIADYKNWLDEKHGIVFTDGHVHFDSEHNYLVFLMKYKEG